MLDLMLGIDAPSNLSPSQLTVFTLLGLGLIVVFARVFGWLAIRVNQPRVIGEIAAGILLGPTLWGGQLPQLLFPFEVRPVLGVIASLGVTIFIFIASLELDLSIVKQRYGQVLLVSVLSVGIPAAGGFLLGPWLGGDPWIGSAGEDELVFALFLGAALSVTAFPVMAYILMERKQLNSSWGSFSMAVAAVTSVLMFLFLGFANQTLRHDSTALAGELLGISLWLVVSFLIIRSLISKMLMTQWNVGVLSAEGKAVILIGLLVYAGIAQALSLHVMIGGFVWGLLIPVDVDLRRQISLSIKDLGTLVFLPAFFAISGLSTDFSLLRVDQIGIILLVVLAAAAVKMVAGIFAMSAGLSGTDALRVGSLMNARGLLVLIVGLNAVQALVFSIDFYTVMVIVALVNTMMTKPTLDLLDYIELRSAWRKRQSLNIKA